MSTGGVVLTGVGGQLGLTLQQAWPQSGLAATYKLHAFSHSDLDITDEQAIRDCLQDLECSVLVNAAAYTQVDRAEEEEEAAFAVNEAGTRNLARWCEENDSRLVHVSTDFVFDGKHHVPYTESDEPEPLGAYGRSKLAGEKALAEFDRLDSAIVRASWLYSCHGNNFVRTMLRLMAEKKELKVIIDQVGSPTSTHSLAAVILALVNNEDASGIYHWCDGAEISWYDFAVAIQKLALDQGLLENKIPIHPIPTEAFPTAATRPEYSVLDRTRALEELGVAASDWKRELDRVITELARN